MDGAWAAAITQLGGLIWTAQLGMLTSFTEGSQEKERVNTEAELAALETLMTKVVEEKVDVYTDACELEKLRATSIDHGGETAVSRGGGARAGAVHALGSGGDGSGGGFSASWVITADGPRASVTRTVEVLVETWWERQPQGHYEQHRRDHRSDTDGGANKIKDYKEKQEKLARKDARIHSSEEQRREKDRANMRKELGKQKTMLRDRLGVQTNLLYLDSLGIFETDQPCWGCRKMPGAHEKFEQCTTCADQELQDGFFCSVGCKRQHWAAHQDWHHNVRIETLRFKTKCSRCGGIGHTKRDERCPLFGVMQERWAGLVNQDGTVKRTLAAPLLLKIANNSCTMDQARSGMQNAQKVRFSQEQLQATVPSYAQPTLLGRQPQQRGHAGTARTAGASDVKLNAELQEIVGILLATKGGPDGAPLYQDFVHPVIGIVVGYHHFLNDVDGKGTTSRAADLSSMLERTKSQDQKANYRRLSQFKDDLRRIALNCEAYNRPRGDTLKLIPLSVRLVEAGEALLASRHETLTRYEAEIVRDEEQVAQSAKRKKCWRTVPAGGAKGPANAHAKAAARKARAAAAAAATVDDAVPDAASGPSCVSLASAAPSQGAELESAGLGSSSEASASELELSDIANESASDFFGEISSVPGSDELPSDSGAYNFGCELSSEAGSEMGRNTSEMELEDRGREFAHRRPMLYYNDGLEMAMELENANGNDKLNAAEDLADCDYARGSGAGVEANLHDGPEVPAETLFESLQSTMAQS